ncbi:hypothetical protein AB4Z50_14955 [Paenibacillus sp. 2TAB26]|uniref:hypothetical protein n=1 Tax=Paenibacillus sp. 2TAB26 TaxID=3233005 RepID=UPI003F96CEB7
MAYRSGPAQNSMTSTSFQLLLLLVDRIQYTSIAITEIEALFYIRRVRAGNRFAGLQQASDLGEVLKDSSVNKVGWTLFYCKNYQISIK